MYLLGKTVQETQWAHTASIVAMVHNTQAKRPRKPEEFNPFTQARKGRRPQRTTGLSMAEACALLEKGV